MRSLFTDMAAITAGWLLVYYIAGGIGSAIGGGKIVYGAFLSELPKLTIASRRHLDQQGSRKAAAVLYQFNFGGLGVQEPDRLHCQISARYSRENRHR